MVYRNDIRIPNRLKLFDPGQCCPYMMSSVTNGGSHPLAEFAPDSHSIRGRRGFSKATRVCGVPPSLNAAHVQGVLPPPKGSLG